MIAVDESDWLDTPALCQALAISRSTLARWRARGLLRAGHHWVRKNPACPRSDLLWHRHRCFPLLGSNASQPSTPHRRYRRTSTEPTPTSAQPSRAEILFGGRTAPDAMQPRPTELSTFTGNC